MVLNVLGFVGNGLDAGVEGDLRAGEGRVGVDVQRVRSDSENLFWMACSVLYQSTNSPFSLRTFVMAVEGRSHYNVKSTQLTL